MIMLGAQDGWPSATRSAGRPLLLATSASKCELPTPRRLAPFLCCHRLHRAIALISEQHEIVNLDALMIRGILLSNDLSILVEPR